MGKLSFSFPSKPSSSSRPSSTRRPQSSQPADTHENGSAWPEEGEAKPHYVTIFDPSETLASDAPTKHVIAPISNADFRGKRMKNLLPPPSDNAPSENRFVLDTSGNDPAAATNISYGLTLRSIADGDDHLRSEPPEDLALQRFKEDIKNLPDDRGFDEFADVPLEDFAAAVLSGYGWSKGKGIGRNGKEDTKIVEYDRRAGTEGLGYVPSASDPKTGRRKRGGGREAITVVHREKNPSPRIVRIVSGRHIGLKGEVLKSSKSSDLVLKLLQSGEEIRIAEDMVAELGSVAEEKCLQRLKEQEILEKHHKSRNSRREERKSSDEGRRPLTWLRNHIRVRIISKNFRGGKLYLKKGEVVDVVGPTTCDISMDGSRELVQGVDQEILETALPKRGGSVLVLYGKNKGAYGSLVERDMEEETGVVRDEDSHALINVRLEQIAEYVGDPSYLGY